MDFSYTGMARTNAPKIVSGVTVAADPNQAEEWFLSLPTAVQAQMKVRLTEIVRSLPEPLRIKLGLYMASVGEPNPTPIPLGGLGCNCSRPGLGQWAALATGLATSLGQAGLQIGGQYLLNQQTVSAQRDLQSDATRANAQLEAARAKAAADAQQLLINAQIQAAQLAQEGMIEQSRISAPTMQKLATYGGVAAVIVAIGGAFYFMRKRK